MGYTTAKRCRGSSSYNRMGTGAGLSRGFEGDADGYSGTTWVYPEDRYAAAWRLHFDRKIRVATCSHPMLGQIARGYLLDVLEEFDRVIAASETPPALRPACD
jgi:hypothetical protein